MGYPKVWILNNQLKPGIGHSMAANQAKCTIMIFETAVSKGFCI